MSERPPITLSPGALRREVSARNLQRAAGGLLHEETCGDTPCVLFLPDDAAGHGNFLAASYRRILANPGWRARLNKAYTSSRRVPRSQDRRRAELDCATSSDALLMNVFCHPGLTRRPAVCRMLGHQVSDRPEFGVRAMLPMRGGEIDRTEIDMRLGSLLVEAKLTEGGFGTATRPRLLRYEGVEEHFDLDQLPRGRAGFSGWQLIRGVLAALHHDARYVVLCDARRPDLLEQCFRVMTAIRSFQARSRMAVLTWQELASTVSPSVADFLAAKYGILAR